MCGDGFSGGIGDSDGARLLCHECNSGGVDEGVVDAGCGGGCRGS
jgi:hypothetical protein